MYQYNLVDFFVRALTAVVMFGSSICSRDSSRPPSNCCSFVAFVFPVAQLEEEAHLLGGTWHTLCEDDETTINADKYSSNEFYCWLVVDPYVTPTPKPMDDEEFIEIKRGVSMQECMRMVERGELSIVSSFIVLMGARKLRQLRLLDDL